MSFKVRLRIKSLKPYQRPAPAAAPLGLSRIKPDPDLLRQLDALLTNTADTDKPVWVRRWDTPGTGQGVPLPGATYFSWEGGVQ